MSIFTLKSARTFLLPLVLFGVSGNAFGQEDKIEIKKKPSYPSFLPPPPTATEGVANIHNPPNPPQIFHSTNDLIYFPTKHGSTYYAHNGNYFYFPLHKNAITPAVLNYFRENIPPGDLGEPIRLEPINPKQDSPPHKPLNSSKPKPPRNSELTSTKPEPNHSETIPTIRPWNISYTPEGTPPRLVFKPEGVLPPERLAFDHASLQRDEKPSMGHMKVPFNSAFGSIEITGNKFSVPALDIDGMVWLDPHGQLIRRIFTGHEFPKISPPKQISLKPPNFSPYSGPIYSNSSILSLTDSGEIKYPDNTSVFACCVQERETAFTELVDIFFTDIDSYINDLINSNNIRKSRYGNSFISEIAHQIHHGQGAISIEHAMVKATNHIVANTIDPDVPQFRLSPKSSINDPDKSFDVIILTGTPNNLLVSEECRRNRQGKLTCQTTTQKVANEYLDKTFKFEAELLARVIKNTYGDRCHSVTKCINPSKSGFEADYRRVMANANGRKVYFIYDGHGVADENMIQQGVRNINMQGSRSHDVYLERFSNSGMVNENYFKRLFAEYDGEIIYGNASCFSGAALTKNENISIEPGSTPVMISVTDCSLSKRNT